MQNRTKQVLATAVAACALFAASRKAAAAPLTYTGGTYGENFDSLPNTSTTTNNTAFGNFPSPGPNDVPNLPGWSFGRVSGTNATIDFYVGDGNTAVLGHAGSHGTAGSTDRALGTVATTASVPNIGFQLINNTATPLNQFTMSFTGEQWRRGTQVATGDLAFSYSTSATNILTGSFIAVPQLNFLGPQNTTPTAVALDGNAAANRTAVTFTVNGFLWNPGQVITFRWNDSNQDNADDWLAIDDLSFTATVFGELPKNLRWNPSNLTGTWDQNVGNTPWLDDTSAASKFKNTDLVTLGATSNDIAIAVDAAGVSPTSTTVSNDTNKYTLSGGALGGQLNKSGAGK